MKYEEERLHIARDLGDRGAEAVALNDLGLAASEQGDFDRAQLYLEQGSELTSELDDPYLALSFRGNLGDLALDQGQFQRAREILEDALVVAKSLGDTWFIAHNLDSLGRALLCLDESRLAAERFREGLSLVGVAPLVASNCLDGLAALGIQKGDAVRAARLAGAAEGVRAGGLESAPAWQAIADRTEHTARLALGNEVWEAERAHGVDMSLAEAAAYALGEPAPRI